MQRGSEALYVSANLSIHSALPVSLSPLMRVVFVSAKAGQHKYINVTSPLPPEAGARRIFLARGSVLELERTERLRHSLATRMLVFVEPESNASEDSFFSIWRRRHSFHSSPLNARPC